MKSRIVSAVMDSKPLPDDIDMFGSIGEKHITKLDIKIIMLWGLLIIICVCHQTNSLFAYSCESSDLKKTAISLVDTPSCIMNNETIESQDVQVVITQTSEQEDIVINRCLIKASHVIKRCARVFGSDQMVGHYQELLEISPNTCLRLVQENKLTLNYNGGVILEFEGPGNYFRSFHTLGEESTDGSCSGYGKLSAQGQSWERVVRYTSFEIEYGTLKGIVDFEEKKVILPIGVRCDLHKESCSHGNYGYLFWKQPVPSCSNQVGNQAILYKGLGQLIYINDTKTSFIQVRHTGVDFQLKLDSRTTSICGYKSYYTEHPKLYITMLHEYSPPFPNVKFVQARDVNLLNYVNSKIVYSMRNVKEQVTKLYHLFEKERCLSESRTIANLLSIATLSPEAFAYSYFAEEGYTTVIRGEVVYVAKCPAVVVRPKSNIGDQCYNELMVEYRNRTMFISPRSRILVHYGNIVKCSISLGPVFRIHGKWMMQTPSGLVPTTPPETIQQSATEYKFENIESIASGGIYSARTCELFHECGNKVNRYRSGAVTRTCEHFHECGNKVNRYRKAQ